MHRGGITPGPYLGDTFVLIEAPSISTLISGGQGAQVNAFAMRLHHRWCLISSILSAWTRKTCRDDVELQTSVQRCVAPFAGAMVRLRYTTLQGQAMLITAQRLKGEVIPMGPPFTMSMTTALV